MTSHRKTPQLEKDRLNGAHCTVKDRLPSAIGAIRPRACRRRVPQLAEARRLMASHSCSVEHLWWFERDRCRQQANKQWLHDCHYFVVRCIAQVYFGQCTADCPEVMVGKIAFER